MFFKSSLELSGSRVVEHFGVVSVLALEFPFHAGGREQGPLCLAAPLSGPVL